MKNFSTSGVPEGALAKVLAAWLSTLAKGIETHPLIVPMMQMQGKLPKEDSSCVYTWVMMVALTVDFIQGHFGGGEFMSNWVCDWRKHQLPQIRLHCEDDTEICLSFCGMKLQEITVRFEGDEIPPAFADLMGQEAKVWKEN